jgi:small subunit ribosomal protein S5
MTETTPTNTQPASQPAKPGRSFNNNQGNRGGFGGGFGGGNRPGQGGRGGGFGGRRNNDRRPQGPTETPEYEQKVLDIARVARVTSGGRRFNFRVTMVIGNKNGKVGVATGRGRDVAIAIDKAARNAKKQLFEVPMTPEGTIPYEIEGHQGSARVLLKPGRQGRGIIAGGPVRAVCELAGYKDLSAKILGRTTNRLSNARATVDALQKIFYTPTPVVVKTEVKKEEKEKKAKKEKVTTEEE